jgi:hypothetical protein
MALRPRQRREFRRIDAQHTIAASLGGAIRIDECNQLMKIGVN